jgi:poly-gamma-glutamate capsule biosynthesis protein CapA/YwtB (metallophosphatase superfamily)
MSVYDARVSSRATRQGAALVAVAALLAGCLDGPTSAPTGGVAPTAAPSGAPTAPPASIAPNPSAPAGITFPLAIVTGLTNLKATVTLDELVELAADGDLLAPCGVRVDEPAAEIMTACIPAEDISGEIRSNPDSIALLPPGLVEPATKVLPIAGDGPYGLFGPDLFGDPEARALPYPVRGTTTDETLDLGWTEHDPAQVWTMTSIGSLCSDRAAAEQAVTRGKGWDWVFGGGTARYRTPPSLNPNPPPGIDQNLYVQPVQTGNAGVVAEVQRRADVAIADHECPILPDRQWSPQSGGALSFAVPEIVVSEWQGTLGIDVVYLAANHMSDRGVAGIESTLRILDRHGLPRTGLGMNLDEALEPAFFDVAGIRVGFVAFNDVGGVVAAGEDNAGVAWITKENINDAVQRALDGGADVVMCDPQWWGGREYHDDLLPKQVRQLTWFDKARCDHVVGAGTHVAGPMLLRQRGADVSLVLASPGNYVFGQDFFQNLQEGVILEQQFVGVRLANVRLHPYVIIRGARPALTDPEGDGRYVLERIWRNSDLRY